MPRALLLFFAALVLSFAVLAQARRPQNQPPQNQEMLDFILDGVWVTDQGEKVNLTHLRGSGAVFATFVGGSSASACPNGGNRPKYIDGKLTGNNSDGTIKLEGTMWRCTRDPDLVRKCGLDSVYQTSFTATVSRNSISGKWHYEWYEHKDTEANCKWVRDSSRDGDSPFSLTTAQPSPTPVRQNTAGVCPPDAAPISPGDEAALEQVTDGIEGAIDQLKDEARELEGAGSTAAQQIDEINGKVAKLEQYKKYWDNIKAAGCIPAIIPQLMRRIREGRGDLCNNLCREVSNWYGQIYPGPQSEYLQSQFFTQCGLQGQYLGCN